MLTRSILLIRPWLLAGLVLAVGLAIVLASVRASTFSPAPAVAAPRPEPVRISADVVRRGDIQQTVSYSGEIRAREQINVLPKSAGRIERVLVDVGSRLEAGETIAVLEQDTAQVGVLQARAALAGAEAKLATLQAGARAEDVAATQAALSQQLVRLQNMRNGGRGEDVRAAQDGLAIAQARLTALQNGADDGVRQAAHSAVDADRAAVASAEAAYAALGAQNETALQNAESQLASLQAQVGTAQALIASADAALANLTGASAADLQAAQSTYDQAYSQLQVAQATLKQAYNPTQAQIAAAEAAVEQARAQRAAAEAQQTALEQNAAPPCADAVVAPGVKINHNSTACGEAKAAADQAIQADEAGIEAAQGQLDLLRRGGSPAQQAQLNASADQAQAQVNTARARLDALKNGGVAAARVQAEAQKQQALGSLVTAQENLRVAQANLSALKRGSLDAQVKNANAQVTAARERLKADEARLDVILRGPTDEDLQQAEAAVDQARQQLVKARQPYTAYDLQQQEQAVAQAQALADKAANPFTEQDLAAAQAAVDQARAALDLNELGLAETTVVAPVTGVIAERLVAPGAMVSPQTPLVTLVPPALELVVNVDESRLGRFREGQNVQLEVPAFIGQTFTGVVNSIAPTLDPRSRTAAVRVEPRDDDQQLRAGMFARLSIVTAKREGVLLVPRDALLPGSAPEVLVIESGTVVRRVPITVGLSSAQFLEVLTGLDDGQLVVTSALNELEDGDQVRFS